MTIEFPGARIRLALDIEDPETAWNILRHPLDSFHERGVAQYFVAAIERAGAFMDIGGYIGWYSCLARRVNPGLPIALFEPNHDNLRRAERNLSLNPGSKQPILIQESVGDEEATCWLVRSGPHSIDNVTLRFQPTDLDFTVVHQTTVDTWYRQNSFVPDVVKIDVEGAEVAVLRGMHQLIHTARPVLFIEIHPERVADRNEDLANELEFLQLKGYDLNTCDKDAGDLKPLAGGGQLNDGNPMIIAYPCGVER